VTISSYVIPENVTPAVLSQGGNPASVDSWNTGKSWSGRLTLGTGSLISMRLHEGKLRYQEISLMKFARVVFSVAAVYGLVVLLPQYFLMEKNGRDFPPAITHAEYYYGFIGVAVAWQIAFLVMAKDPARYRPLMLPAVVEKAGFGIVACLLYMLGRLSVSLFAAGIIDLVLGLLFGMAYRLTPSERKPIAAE
jgi:hypothetical protein